MKRNQELTQKARALRKNATREESLLWNNFLRRYQPKFHRQYVIGNYIVDFYCHAAKLAVELDGSQHYNPEGKEYDKKRTDYLEGLGLKVIRFSNLDVTRRFQDVCEDIYRNVEVRTTQGS